MAAIRPQTPKHRAPGATTYKSRREFRAWMLSELSKLGERLPADASYTDIRAALKRTGFGS